MENLGLVLKVTGKDLKSLFVLQDRDYYSLDACNAIVERYEDSDYNTQEVDIIELCGIYEELTEQELIERYIEYTGVNEGVTTQVAYDIFDDNSYIKKLENGKYLIECF